MKKVLLMVAAAALVGQTSVPALAQDDGEAKFTFNGMVRSGFDSFNNYFDLKNTGTAGANDDGVSLWPYRVMAGINGQFSQNVSAHIGFQYVGAWGDELSPQKDVLPPIGQFNTPYQFNTPGVQLYTAYVDLAKLGGTDFGLRVGRQEHTYGTELFMGDNDYYAGLSFDGIRAMWKHGHNDLNGFYYHVAEGNGPANSFRTEDSNFFGATYDYNFEKVWGTVGGYVLVAQDLGGFGPIGAPDSKLYTIGARWNKAMAAPGSYKGGDMFDWNLELASQTGDKFGPTAGPKVDISAWVYEGWFAFNFGGDKSHGRAHIGFLSTSGDKTSTTKDENFVPLYGDFHANNRFGDLDFIDTIGNGGPQNITDVNLGYEHWFGNHSLMIAAHWAKLTEKNALTEDSLGTEVDLKYGYRYSKNVGMEVGLGEWLPGKALEAAYGVTSSDPVSRIAARLTLTF